MVLALPLAFAAFTADPARREWLLSGRGWLGGMGGGPNQLWALVACVLSGVSLLTAAVALQQQ